MSVLRQEAQAFATPIRRVWPLIGLGYLVVTLVAVLPRVLGLGRFVTVDEIDHWIDRSAQFLTAIQTGDLGGTAITSHPGVTTMWLGSMGLMAYQRVVAWGLVPDGDFAIKLAFMQLPVALVNAGGVVLGYHLLRRMFPAAIAICAALFWAADPFVIGYSRVLHNRRRRWWRRWLPRSRWPRAPTVPGLAIWQCGAPAAR
jgi:hypothetical protein